jgi:hypothetical protein
MPSSDLEAASGPICWGSLIPCSVKVGCPTIHTWSEFSAERMSQSRPLNPVKATDLSHKTENGPWFSNHRDLDSGIASHKCRLWDQSGLRPNSGPSTSFVIIGHSFNLPVSSLFIFSIGIPKSKLTKECKMVTLGAQLWIFSACLWLSLCHISCQHVWDYWV